RSTLCGSDQPTFFIEGPIAVNALPPDEFLVRLDIHPLPLVELLLPGKLLGATAKVIAGLVLLRERRQSLFVSGNGARQVAARRLLLGRRDRLRQPILIP